MLRQILLLTSETHETVKSDMPFADTPVAGSARSRLYRDRAREVRAVAETCIDGVIKQQLLIVAAEYDTLARQVEEGSLGRH